MRSRSFTSRGTVILLAMTALIVGLLPISAANAYTGGFHFHEGRQQKVGSSTPFLNSLE